MPSDQCDMRNSDVNNITREGSIGLPVGRAGDCGLIRPPFVVTVP